MKGGPRLGGSLRRYGGTVAAALLLGVVLRYMILPWIHPATGPTVGIEPMTDFQRAVFYPVTAFLEGGNPYNRDWYLRSYPAPSPFLLYLPATLVLHLPFGLLPLESAALAYLLVSLLLSLGLAFASLKFSGVAPRASHVMLLTALVLLSRPGRQNLLVGQVTLQVVLASYVALAASRSAPLLSGLGLALSLLKPTYGVPLATLMLFRGDLRAVASGATIAAAINAPLLWLLVQRAGGIRSFVADLGGTLEASSTALIVANPATSVYRIDLVALLSRLAGQPIGAAAQVLVALAVLMVAGLMVRRVQAGRGAGEATLSASIICLAILVSVYHQVYDLLLLTLPFVGLAYRRLPAALLLPRFRWWALGMFGLLAANYVSGNSLLRRLQLVSDVGGGVLMPKAGGLLLGSINGVVLLLLLAHYCWAVFRAGPLPALTASYGATDPLAPAPEGREVSAGPSGGTADAVDSKSTGGNPVRVRISPRAFGFAHRRLLASASATDLLIGRRTSRSLAW
jgi:hypothetical protein